MSLEKQEYSDGIVASAQKKLRAHLDKEWILKRFPDLFIQYIWEGVIASGGKNNVDMYNRVTRTGDFEPILSVINTRKDPFFNLSLDCVGYREILSPSRVYEMYKKDDIDKKTSKARPGAVPLPKLSLENFHLWENIDFFNNKLLIKNMVRDTIFWGKEKYFYIGDEAFEVFVRSKSIRLGDAKFFVDRGRLGNKIFKQMLPELQNALLSQISDSRFEKANDPVTREEIEEYYEQWLISKGLYETTMRKLEELQTLRETKNKGQWAIKDRSKKERAKI